MGGGDEDGQVQETPEEKALAEVARKKWNDVQKNIVPIQNEYLNEIQQDQGDYLDAEGSANVDTQAAFDKAKEKALRPGAGEGSLLKGLENMSQGRGGAAGESIAAAGHATTDRHYKGLRGALAMGESKSGTSQQMLTQSAQEAQQDEMVESRQDYLDRQATGEMVGAVAGAGGRYAQEKWGNTGGGPSGGGSAKGMQPKWG